MKKITLLVVKITLLIASCSEPHDKDYFVLSEGYVDTLILCNNGVFYRNYYHNSILLSDTGFWEMKKNKHVYLSKFIDKNNIIKNPFNTSIKEVDLLTNKNFLNNEFSEIYIDNGSEYYYKKINE